MYKLRLGQLQDRLCRLTDAYLDGSIDKQIFEERRAALLMQRKELEENLGSLKDSSRSLPERLAEFLELAGSTYLLYKTSFLMKNAICSKSSPRTGKWTAKS